MIRFSSSLSFVPIIRGRAWVQSLVDPFVHSFIYFFTRVVGSLVLLLIRRRPAIVVFPTGKEGGQEGTKQSKTGQQTDCNKRQEKERDHW